MAVKVEYLHAEIQQLGEQGVTGNASNPGSSHSCTLCSKTYTRRNSMLRHVRTDHGQRGIEEHFKLRHGKKQCKCTLCGQFLKNKRSLRKHMSRQHQMISIPDNPLVQCRESGCKWFTSEPHRRRALLQHLENVHGMNFDVVENLKFDTVEEFDCWCDNIKSVGEEPTHLVEGISGHYRLKLPEDQGRIRRYRECYRSGRRVSKSKGIRSSSTARIGFRCTFCIQYVCEVDGSVTVEEAVLNHYGHKADQMKPASSKSKKRNSRKKKGVLNHGHEVDEMMPTPDKSKEKLEFLKKQASVLIDSINLSIKDTDQSDGSLDLAIRLLGEAKNALKVPGQPTVEATGSRTSRNNLYDKESLKKKTKRSV